MLLLMLGAIAVVALIYGILMATMGKKEALAAVFGPVVRRPVDFPSLELRPTPNQFLVCPPGYCKQATPHMESPAYQMPVGELRDAFLRMATSHAGVTLLSSDQEGEQYTLEALTPLMGFPDTVTVRFLPAGEGRSTLAVYSRSHYGKSDFGANEKRIRGWLGELGR